MSRTPVLVAVVVACAGPVAIHAQVRGDGHGVATTSVASDRKCSLCHFSHTGDGEGSLAVGSPLGEIRNVSPTSRSCLRCHATPSARASDPAFENHPLTEGTASDWTFLGSLTDDHPLAQAGDGNGAVSYRSRWLRSSASGVSRTPTAGSSTMPLPECTSCHNVHSGPDPALNEEGQQGLCLECHATAEYLGGHVTTACTSCHALHGGRDFSLLREANVDFLCQSCHDPAGADWPSRGVAPPVIDPQRHDGGPDIGFGGCSNCHPVHHQ